jgi:hypothetical protein
VDCRTKSTTRREREGNVDQSSRLINQTIARRGGTTDDKLRFHRASIIDRPDISSRSKQGRRSPDWGMFKRKRSDEASDGASASTAKRIECHSGAKTVQPTSLITDLLKTCSTHIIDEQSYTRTLRKTRSSRNLSSRTSISQRIAIPKSKGIFPLDRNDSFCFCTNAVFYPQQEVSPASSPRQPPNITPILLDTTCRLTRNPLS